MTTAAARRQRWWCVATLSGAALLAGCASAPPPTPIAAPTAPARMVAPAPDPGRAAFELNQQQRAHEAERQGRLADAAWAWEVLTVLDATRADWQAQRQRLTQLVQQRAASALAQAQQDRQRGELDRATRGYLQVLSLTPEHTGAADALRGIERERNERQFLGRFSRLTITRNTLAEAQSRAPDAAATTDSRNLSEHATLLAAQGEFDGAIALLTGAASARTADPALRRLLADLHYRRAEALPEAQAAQVLEALRECLRLDPAHEGAAARLKALTTTRR